MEPSGGTLLKAIDFNATGSSLQKKIRVHLTEMEHRKLSVLPGIILFVVFVVIGLTVYQDYGMAWDEDTQRDIGLVSYNYIFKDDQRLLTYLEKDHGVGFELPLLFLEKGLNTTDSRDVFLMRHLATHLFFLVSVFFGYLLSLRLFKSQWLALLGFVMLVMHPRIYAHSYFNTKDLPFLCMFMLCFFIAEYAFRKNSLLAYVLLGLACGYTTSIRILGILLIAFISFFLFVDLVKSLIRKEKIVSSLANLVFFLLAFYFTLVLAWPTLWSSPVNNFVDAFKNLSHFRWEGFVLFKGELVKGTQLPWTYLPTWFIITTPVLWLVIGFAGIIWVVFKIVQRPSSFIMNFNQRNFLLYLLCFIAPITMVIFLNSVVYDDWRHVYFVYPSFVLLGILFLSQLKGYWKNAAQIGCLLQVVFTGITMVKIHPFQQVYFNRLVSHQEESLRRNFDLDYWGCSYIQGLNYIVEHDPRKDVKIAGLRAPISNNIMMLQKQDRSKFSVVDTSQNPDYFITNFRLHPQDFNYPETYFDMKRQNSTILRVYKLH